jgi:tetratricopeptide (TPR) repeat protein
LRAKTLASDHDPLRTAPSKERANATRTFRLSIGLRRDGLRAGQSPPAKNDSAQQADTQINALLVEGDKLRDAQKLREAEASYFDALQMAKKANRTELQARAQLKIANIAASFGNYDWALQAVDATIPLLDEQQSPDLLAEAMVRRGRYATRLNDFKTALAANLKAIEIAQKRHNTVIMAETSNDLLPSLVWYRRLDDVVAYGSAGLLLCSQIEGAVPCFRDALGGLSDVYDARGDYDRSCRTALAAIGFGRENGESIPISHEETLMMRCLQAKGLLDLSISVGIDAVNFDQRRRVLVADHIADVRSSFAWSTAYTYQELADALFQQNQIDEGEFPQLLRVGTRRASALRIPG